LQRLRFFQQQSGADDQRHAVPLVTISVVAFRRLADFATLQASQPSIRLAMCHVQSGEFVFLPCFKRSLTKGFTLFFTIKKFSYRFTEDPVGRAIAGLS
jgi:hypothetical protein